MFTVALIGPDGAGKTTIGRRIEHSLPTPVKYVYMGVNLEASNVMLPTTRLLLEFRRMRGRRPDMAGPPDPNKVRAKPKGLVKRSLAVLKSSLRLANQLGEEWYRQSIVWYHQRRGSIVLFDRHFFTDYYATDINGRGPEKTIYSKIHGFVLKRFYPRPNMVIVLDAPAEVLFARKGEGTIELLERRRQEYLRLRDQVESFAVVDVRQTEDEVAREVAALIWDYYRAKTGNSMTARDAQS